MGPCLSAGHQLPQRASARLRTLQTPDMARAIRAGAPSCTSRCVRSGLTVQRASSCSESATDKRASARLRSYPSSAALSKTRAVLGTLAGWGPGKRWRQSRPSCARHEVTAPGAPGRPRLVHPTQATGCDAAVSRALALKRRAPLPSSALCPSTIKLIKRVCVMENSFVDAKSDLRLTSCPR